MGEDIPLTANSLGALPYTAAGLAQAIVDQRELLKLSTFAVANHIVGIKLDPLDNTKVLFTYDNAHPGSRDIDPSTLLTQIIDQQVPTITVPTATPVATVDVTIKEGLGLTDGTLKYFGVDIPYTAPTGTGASATPGTTTPAGLAAIIVTTLNAASNDFFNSSFAKANGITGVALSSDTLTPSKIVLTFASAAASATYYSAETGISTTLKTALDGSATTGTESTFTAASSSSVATNAVTLNSRAVALANAGSYSVLGVLISATPPAIPYTAATLATAIAVKSSSIAASDLGKANNITGVTADAAGKLTFTYGTKTFSTASGLADRLNDSITIVDKTATVASTSCHSAVLVTLSNCARVSSTNFLLMQKIWDYSRPM